MAIEILTPQLGKVKKTTKDLIISTLMYDHPLNIARLTNAIKNKFQASVTFQGVRKAVNQLAENGVLIKHGKEYDLNRDWILELRNFAEKLQESHFTKRTGIKDIQAIGEDIKVYTFDNLIDVDIFWNRLIAKWFDDSKNADDEHNMKNKDGKSNIYVQQSGHTWYVLANLEEETSVIEKMRKKNIQFYTLASGNTFLDAWCRKYYHGLGFNYAVSKKRVDTSKYFAVYEDYVVQCDYPPHLADELDKIYRSANTFESFEATKLIKILRQKAELKVTVMRNPVVAEQLRNYILDHFKK